MGRQAWEESEARFVKYLDGLTSVIGHADRAGPLKGYCTGLLAAEGRRSVEPMAAVTAPAGVSAQHQKLLHFVANAAWSDELVLAKVQEMVLPQIERHGPIEAWIIDDTSFPKQGRHSVGVHHQYCGQLGKQANCQVVVTLSIANHHASLPIAYRLYLPEAWVGDAARRKKARIPEEISFQTKPEIALDQVRAACAAGVARGVVLMDASYGSNSALRGGVSALAHRARLPGSQAGDRAWALRRTRMARLPPSRHVVHRRLWIPGLREGDDSPLRNSFLQEPHENCATRRLPTPRRPRSGPNVTCPTRLPPCIADWSSPSLERCPDAHAAHVASPETPGVPYDAVGLANRHPYHWCTLFSHRLPWTAREVDAAHHPGGFAGGRT